MQPEGWKCTHPTNAERISTVNGVLIELRVQLGFGGISPSLNRVSPGIGVKRRQHVHVPVAKYSNLAPKRS